MIEHPTVDELLTRATLLAHKHRSFEVIPLHLVWAYAASASGEAAVALRVACRAANAPLAQPLAEPPPLRAGLAQILAEEAPNGRVSPENLLALVQRSSAAASLLGPLQAWLVVLASAHNGDADVAEPPASDPVPTVLWQRYELDSGHRDGLPFVDIVRQGNKVCARTGRTKKQKDEGVEIEVTELKSEASAERSLERRIQTLLTKEYRLVGTVERAVPAISSKQERALAKASHLAERAQQIVGFAERMLRFFEVWEARGYDPLCSFQQEGQRKREDWNAIATACLELAATELNVNFTRRTEVDEEHGTLGSIGARNLASFYRSPAFVADIAFAKTRGELRSTDGAFPDWYAEKRRQQLGDAALDPFVASIVARFRLRKGVTPP